MFFLKNIRTNSECQFKTDFGEYPPKPLSRMKVNTQFNILSSGKVGIFFYHLATFSSFFYLTFVGKPPFNSNSDGMTIITNAIAKIRKLKLNVKKIWDTKIKSLWITEIKPLKNSPFQYQFVLIFLLLIACSPFMLLFMLFFIVYIFILCFIEFLKLCTFHGYGYFIAFTNRPSEVVINTSAIKKSKNSSDKLVRTIPFESIVSHEHIHVLQNYYFQQRRNLGLDSEKVNFLKSLLKEPENNFARVSYLFCANEMEARLHEVVLSYYRKYGELPSDEIGFLKLLFGSRGGDLDPSFFEALENRPYPKQIEYDTRCEKLENELLYAIFELTEPYNYLDEVLPVMYGNLLIVYGDTNRAKKYFETISSFELYNQLYGEIIIPA
jgi:hypothetical protein